MKRLIEYFRYLRRRMQKDPMPPRRVAAGWALGMFIGCTVPFGLQLILSIPLSFLFKISKVGATLGTFVTNPLTIVFIYPVQIWVGARVLGASLGGDELSACCTRLMGVSLLSAEGWHTLAEISGIILGGFFLGGFLFAFILTPLTYFGVKHIVERRKRK